MNTNNDVVMLDPVTQRFCEGWIILLYMIPASNKYF